MTASLQIGVLGVGNNLMVDDAIAPLVLRFAVARRTLSCATISTNFSGDSVELHGFSRPGPVAH